MTWHGFRDPSAIRSQSSISPSFAAHTNWISFNAPACERREQAQVIQGWTHQNSVRKRDYVKSYDGFVDPSGKPTPTITNLAKFCREHSLDRPHMLALVGRQTHQPPRVDAPTRQTEAARPGLQRFRGAGGAFTIITNLAAFCRACDLSVVHMHQSKAANGPATKAGPGETTMNPKLLNGDGSPKYTNHLTLETSPYLQHHAHNPVDWYPWGDVAFERARQEKKPIHLSVGYSACHCATVSKKKVSKMKPPLNF